MSGEEFPRDLPNEQFAYLFEAKGIQRYILASGKLRDIVGASDLVNGLTRSEAAGQEMSGGSSGSVSTAMPTEGDLLGEVWSAIHPGADPEPSRRAGGAFVLHFDDEERLQEFRALWRLAAMLRCPGLEMSESVGFADEGQAGPSAAMAARKDAFENASAVREFCRFGNLPHEIVVHDRSHWTGMVGGLLAGAEPGPFLQVTVRQVVHLRSRLDRILQGSDTEVAVQRADALSHQLI